MHCARHLLLEKLASFGKRVNLFCVLVLLTACQSTPIQRARDICTSCTALNIKTDENVELLTWLRGDLNRENILHIYLEGDGNPWRRGRTPSPNPTSKKMLALNLMQHDPYPSAYLNRPCYGYNEPPSTCSTDAWTSARYSPWVVEQLSKGIDRLKERTNVRSVILVGHSGGGTLAFLISQRRDDVEGIITIGANLDHQAWTQYFRYLPLQQSLNPAQMPPLPDHIQRWHFFGDEDTQVPLEVALKGVENDTHARIEVVSGYDHHCCWEDVWRRTIREFRKDIVER